MAANRFGIDVSQLYRDKESIEGARTRNKLSSLQLGEAEREIRERPAKEAEAKRIEAEKAGLRKKIIGGDKNAKGSLLAIDPEGGAKFIEAGGKMDDREIEAAKRKVDQMGQFSATILNAKPEKQKALYGELLKTLPPEAVAKMPKELDLNFLEVSLAKARSMDKILENPKSIRVGDEDVVYQGGQEIDRGKRSSSSGSGTGSGGVKAADESLMYRQAAEYLGGMFDASGNLQALDPEIRPKVQAIATRASEIFKQGKVTRSQAVTMAAEEVEGSANVEDNDPLGLR